MLEVANLILVVGSDVTVHDVRQKFRCQKCKAKGNNTYQIVWGGVTQMWRLMVLRLSQALSVAVSVALL